MVQNDRGSRIACACLMSLVLILLLAALNQQRSVGLTPFARITGGSGYSVEKGKPPLVLVSYCRHDKPTTHSERANALQMNNLLSWAYTNGYDVMVVPFDLDERFPKGWNKWIALNATLAHGSSQSRPWIMWIDGDAAIYRSLSVEQLLASANPGCDLYIDGVHDQVFVHSDYHDGFNTGVFIARNTPWLNSFISDALNRVLQQYNELLKTAAADCSHKACGNAYAIWHISDQLVLGYLLANERLEEAEQHVCLTDWKLQVHWLDAMEMEKQHKDIEALSVHFSGMHLKEDCTEPHEARIA